jgi:hypothetical protein
MLLGDGATPVVDKMNPRKHQLFDPRTQKKVLSVENLSPKSDKWLQRLY